MHLPPNVHFKSIAILANPLAGKGGSKHFLNWLEKQLLIRQISFVVFKNEWPINFNEFTDIWILGGDGSINFFINQFPDCKIPLVLFKTGTGNDFAWKLYGDLNNYEIFEKVLQLEPQAVDVGKCNNTLFINSFGIGFDGEILKSMNAIRFLGGPIGYLLAVILKIFSFREKKFTVTCGDEQWKEKFLLLIINNSSRAGGGFNITPLAEINDGKLDLFICKPLSIIQRLRYLPVLKSGNHMGLSFLINRLGTSFQIFAEKEMAIQVDGELIFAQEVSISILPKHFMFRY